MRKSQEGAPRLTGAPGWLSHLITRQKKKKIISNTVTAQQACPSFGWCHILNGTKCQMVLPPVSLMLRLRAELDSGEILKWTGVSCPPWSLSMARRTWTTCRTKNRELYFNGSQEKSQGWQAIWQDGKQAWNCNTNYYMNIWLDL